MQQMTLKFELNLEAGLPWNLPIHKQESQKVYGTADIMTET